MDKQEIYAQKRLAREAMRWAEEHKQKAMFAWAEGKVAMLDALLEAQR